MPLRNNFRHQRYTADPPGLAPEFVVAPDPALDREMFLRRMAQVGDVYRAAGVRAIYLVHGTFTGTDALDLARWVGHLAPSVAIWARRNQKAIVDAMLGDQGNFTPAYAAEFEEALSSSGEPIIPVRLFHWSSQNHHVGRADAALRLLDELLSREFAAPARVLLWGHSHAGNVFALLTNLLGADPEPRRSFFDPLRPYYGRQGPGAEMLARIESSFEGAAPPLAGVALDFVTFGTPVRYGWDTGAYAKLLHVVFHRAADPEAPHRVVFPFALDDLLNAAQGDYIQQIGIAGTNFAPHLLAWQTWRTELRLHALLQPEMRRRDLAARLAVGMRVPEEGRTLLVDYGPQGANLARYIAGHAVYTRREYLLFHAEEVARCLYR